MERGQYSHFQRFCENSDTEVNLVKADRTPPADRYCPAFAGGAHCPQGFACDVTVRHGWVGEFESVPLAGGEGVDALGIGERRSR